MNMYLIYRFTSKTSNKSYIGLTSKTIEQRWLGHCQESKRRQKYHFHRAIAAYGIEDWSSEILMSNIPTLDEANKWEMHFIKKYRTFEPDVGYNMTLGGDGCRANESTKKKLSEKLKGRKDCKGIPHPGKRKKVICLTTGILYESLKKAEEITGISGSNICQCCLGKRKTAGNMEWKFA